MSLKLHFAVSFIDLYIHRIVSVLIALMLKYNSDKIAARKALTNHRLFVDNTEYSVDDIEPNHAKH